MSEHVPLYYLITLPRTCSNLLVRMLALDQQPNIFPAPEHGGYFFKPYFHESTIKKLWSKPVHELSEQEAAWMKEPLQAGADTFGRHVATARSMQKGTLVKEHAVFMTNPVAMSKHLHGPECTTAHPSSWGADPRPAAFNETTPGEYSDLNNTAMPDQFLRAWKPIFLIRNPISMFPSFYRASHDLKFDDDGTSHRMTMTMHWNRTLYDWYVRQFEATAAAQNGDAHQDEDAQWPIILDADDVMTEPGVVIRLSEIIGLDPSKLQFSWERTPKESVENMPPDTQRMLSSLLASSGIDKSKVSANLNIETEAKKWREEFGEEGGAKIEKFVRDAMPDYEYMKAKRLRPTQ